MQHQHFCSFWLNLFCTKVLVITDHLWTIQGSRPRPFFENVLVRIWRGCTHASAWSALLQSVCFIQRALQSRHIVAGVRFHWSREERRFQREASWLEPGLYSSFILKVRSHQTRMTRINCAISTNLDAWTFWVYSREKKNAPFAPSAPPHSLE